MNRTGEYLHANLNARAMGITAATGMKKRGKLYPRPSISGRKNSKLLIGLGSEKRR